METITLTARNVILEHNDREVSFVDETRGIRFVLWFDHDELTEDAERELLKKLDMASDQIWDRSVIESDKRDVEAGSEYIAMQRAPLR